MNRVTRGFLRATVAFAMAAAFCTPDISIADDRANLRAPVEGKVTAYKSTPRVMIDGSKAVKMMTTPDGNRVPVVSAVGSKVISTQDEGLRAPPNEFTLLDSVGDGSYGIPAWTQELDFVQPAGNVPYYISHLEIRSGSPSGADRVDGSDDNFWLDNDRYMLIEFWGEFLCDAPDNAFDCTPFGPQQSLHKDYLGGLLVNIGKHGEITGAGEADQDFPAWTIDFGTNAIEGDNSTFFSFAYLPAQDTVVLAARMGFVDDMTGQFVAADEDTDVDGLSFIYSSVGGGGFYNVGNLVDSTMYIDGFQDATPDASNYDRIVDVDDGPIVFGNDQTQGVLGINLRGKPSEDCDGDGVPDFNAIICGIFGADGACAPDGCEYFQDLNTNSFWNTDLWKNPLSGSETRCVPEGADVNTNAILDSCDMADCNTNMIEDVCDLSCDSESPVNGDCEVAYPGQCGLSKNCNGGAIPDECELAGNDCNNNGNLDSCDIIAGTASDCNENGVVDSCEIADCEPGDGTCADCDNDGIIDRCQRTIYFDCNRNGQEDYCDITQGLSNDLNLDGLPDECGGEQCNMRWGGFEEAEFGLATGSTVGGYDSDGDGDAWLAQTTGADEGRGYVFNGSPQAYLAGCPGMAFHQRFNAGTSFTNSELFVSDGGDIPLAVPAMSVAFDWRCNGSTAANGLDPRGDFLMYLVGARGNGTIALLRWVGMRPEEQVNPPDDTTVLTANHLYVLDDTAGWVDTGKSWVGNTCYRTKVAFDPGAGTVEVFFSDNGGASYDSVYTGAALDSGERMDFWQVSFDPYASGLGANTTMFAFDNVEICETGALIDCSSYIGADGQPSSDCDGDGICDLFQLAEAGADLNANYILDRCEGLCGDCNHNAIPDDYEIAQQPSLDANTNGVLDVCDTFTGTIDTSFESPGYSLGELNGQNGWYELDSANDPRSLTTVKSGASGYSGMPTGNQYIQLVDANTNSDNLVALLLSPRVSGQDAQVERWQWDQVMTNGNFGSMWVEVADACEDQPEDYSGTLERINNDAFFDLGTAGLPSKLANVGFEFRSTNADDTAEDLLYVRDRALGIYDWPVTADTDVRDLTDDYGQTRTGRFEIYNGRGQWLGYYGAQGNPQLIDTFGGSATYLDETQGEDIFPSQTCPNKAFASGGDSQLIIRVGGDFGHPSAQFLFDNIKYEAHQDCDMNGIIDSIWLTMPDEINGSQTYAVRFDKNSDGIPDLCQDCNNNCTDLANGNHSASCLDPVEITNGAADANNNGIPDYCDVNTNDLPYYGLYDYTGPGGNCSCISNDFNSQTFETDWRCYMTRQGGGSCDANNDGIPDEVTPGFTDCNNNGCHDPFEPEGDTINGIPDECEPDCNNNGQSDVLDIQQGQTQDVFGATVPTSTFPDSDGIPDECCLSDTGADFDADGDVDLDDYSFLITCSGDVVRLVTVVPGAEVDCIGCQCGCADLNGDSVIDELDVQAFRLFVTGPM